MNTRRDIAATRPIAILGARGQIGFELVRALQPYAPVYGYTRDVLDIGNPEQCAKRLRALEPGVIINAAGYTAVDAAESDPDQAMSLNGVAPAHLAALAAELGACFVHYSSDYVFDGRADTAYTETDPTAPINHYGATKLAGDRAVLDSNAAAIVLRTAWVYGRRGRNFMQTMQGLARDRKTLRIVHDQIGCPTPARFIAETTAAILQRCGFSTDTVNERRGVYHLAAGGSASWCDFARAIMRGSPGLEHTNIEAITTSEFPTAAARPARSVLDCTRIAQAFGVHLPDWDALLKLELEA